jgi:hypothetical protein
MLDARVLPEYESWDVRRYGGTRIAIRIVERAGDSPVTSDETQAAAGPELSAVSVSVPASRREGNSVEPSDDDADA